jgi:hypothetical protein
MFHRLRAPVPQVGSSVIFPSGRGTIISRLLTADAGEDKNAKHYTGAGRVFGTGDDLIFPTTSLKNQPGTAASRHSRTRFSSAARAIAVVFFVLVLLVLVVIPAAGEGPGAPAPLPAATPEIVHVGVYVVDFNRFNVEEGTYETNFYLTLSSDTNISLSDLEIMNGQISSMNTITDTPGEKVYRIYAVLTADPDLRRYPFDNHTLPIIIEPKTLTEKDMVFVIDKNNTGLDSEADLPGWELTGSQADVTNKTYVTDEIPYSRAVFSYGIMRDVASTVLKFFLPITLIIVVSLTSLLMKVSSRLGLNASMFLAAVLIHWRIADAIPLVAYATFLDFFMILTYATLVMVLVSGILIVCYSEAKNMVKVEQVDRWSIRIIPAVSISLYFLLFLMLLI